MSDNESRSVDDADGEASWPRKLNKALIGVGVIAFGLIITDRLINMFQADDLPEVAEVSQTEVAPQAAQELTEPVASKATPADVDDVESATNVPLDETVLEIEDVFGSRLVFVSFAEPQYVVTEDETKIELRGSIDEQTTLAGISNQQLIIERAGSLLPVALPDLSTD